MADDQSDKIFSGLNEAQEQAVRATEGPVLILAGAGSGKTKCLTHRLAYIVALKQAELSQILAITFTNKASQELGERILKILDYPTTGFKTNPAFALRRALPWVGTFHSICVRLLRNEAVNIGLSPNFTIFDSDDSLSLIRQILKEKNLDPKQYAPQAVSSIISNAKNELMNPDQYAPFAQGHFQQIALEVYRAYQKRLGELSALDFDDLIKATVEMLEKYPEIRAKYNEQFRYVMVDEYQDTNHSQYRLTFLLTNPKTNNLCVVGDDFQSIYSWRGANFQNILNFHRDYEDTQVFKLEENYRSTKTILAGADQIITHVKKRSEKKLWTRNEDGAPITVFEASNAYAEADFLVTEIRTLHGMGYDWNDFAVLYRTNAQSRILEEIFLGEGLPYRLIGALRFYERKEIKDLLAYLRFILNPADTNALARAINTPPRGIGPKTLEKGGPKVDAFLEQMQSLREMVGQAAPSVILEKLLSVIKFREFLHDGTPEGESRWENVEEMLNLSTEFENLNEFLEHVALVSDVDNYDSSAEAVTLMTLHSSKGLEFTTVFITGFEEGLCPHIRSLEDESEMDEERRLTYVGMTRAKKRLYLTYARQRLIHGGLTVTLPSRFLNELDEGLLDRV
ncbi:MAG TPA: UvrD-helicase domain-containing protein [Candidatus Saccharimonadales bacterium]|nr:UvrD-helicase domain-containing protein [Candidatus Saccharimonadales bacterium]